MPTRQPTPGPSTPVPSADVLQPHNAKKRAVSENLTEDEQRQSKKHRKDLELASVDKAVANTSSSKDNKKKRRKKKRKSPLTLAEIVPEPAPQHQAKSNSPIPLSLASSTTLSETSIPSPITTVGPVKNGESSALAGSPTIAAQDDVKPVLSVDSSNLDSMDDSAHIGCNDKSVDKGKGRAIPENPDNLIPQLSTFTSVAGPSQVTDSMKEAQAKIAELTAQLDSQKTLLSRYEDNLSHLQQSLTCEICLDLLYKPFSLSPCGHVACYMCLIRWFTSVQGNPNVDANPVTELDDVPRLLTSQPAARGVFLRNRKTCPLCRAAIVERPAEIWSIKSMVANLIKSKLVGLPSAPPPSAIETPNADNGNARNSQQNDPWRNVFHRPKRRGHHHDHQPHFFPPPPQNNGEAGGAWNIEDMGMYDAEDGGIYRCLECFHEIWGGVCTNCHREYAGHARFDDDDDYSESDLELGENFLGRRLREIWDGYAQDDPGWAWGGGAWRADHEDDDDDDGDESEGEHYLGPLHPVWNDVLTDESMSDAGSDLGGHDTGSGSGSGEDDDGGSSDGSWSSDGEEDDHHHLLDHRRELIEAMHGIPNWPLGQRFRHREPGVAHIEEVDGDDDEEDEEGDGDSLSDSDSHSHSHPHSGDEEDSFIDDDEEGGANEYHLRHRGQHHRHIQGPELAELFDSDDDGDGDDDDNEQQVVLDGDNNVGDPREIARQLGRGMRLGGGGRGAPPPVIPGPARRNGRRRQSPIVVEVDIDDEDDLGENRAGDGGGRRGAGLGRTGRRRVVHDESSEEDGDEDEEVEEVRPAGRRRGNARPRVYETDADDESE